MYLFQNKPANVSVEEASHAVVWVFLGVGVTVVGSMAERPPLGRALDSRGAATQPDESQNPVGFVRFVRETSVVT